MQAHPAPIAHPKKPTSGSAILALIFAILGVFIPFVFSILAIVLGHFATWNIKRAKGKLGGRGLAIGSLIAGCAGLLLNLILAAIFLPVLFAVMNDIPLTIMNPTGRPSILQSSPTRWMNVRSDFRGRGSTRIPPAISAHSRRRGSSTPHLIAFPARMWSTRRIGIRSAQPITDGASSRASAQPQRPVSPSRSHPISKRRGCRNCEAGSAIRSSQIVASKMWSWLILEPVRR